jgi:transposase InsO family protein
VIVRFISEHKDRFEVEPICRLLTQQGCQIAPSTYYDAARRAPSARAVRDEQLKAVISRVHRDNYGVYGARKIWLQPNREGMLVAGCMVERLFTTALVQLSSVRPCRAANPGLCPARPPQSGPRTRAAAAHCARLTRISARVYSAHRSAPRR